MNTTHHSYEEAFAYWAPIYRTRHERLSAESLPHVKADIVATLAIWGADRTPYTAKLLAELDAVRDRELAIRRTNTNVAKLGFDACKLAYDYSRQGEGPSTIAQYLGLTVRQANAAIDAGRALFSPATV